MRAISVSPIIFYVKDACRSERSVVKNVDKITRMMRVGRYVSKCSIVKELDIDHKTLLNYLHRAAFKMKLNIWMSHQLTHTHTKKYV